jgi:hypothetical protein
MSAGGPDAEPHDVAMALAIAAEEEGAGGEEGGGGGGEEDDGVAVGGLDGRGRGLGVVEALGAALKEGHWPNSRRRKRKIQRTPMQCQYQTVESTSTWRVERERERCRAIRAAMRAAMPRKRWMAWVTVMR